MAGKAALKPITALHRSLDDLGRIDMEYVSRLCGRGIEETVAMLSGAVYLDPDKLRTAPAKDSYVLAEEYLSGRIDRKLKSARAVSPPGGGQFDANIRALEAVMPRAPGENEIMLRLGSPLLDTAVLDGFIDELVNRKKVVSYNARTGKDEFMTMPGLKTVRDAKTGRYRIPLKEMADRFRNRTLYGTSAISALSILEKTLNGQKVLVYRKVEGKRRLDPRASYLASLKQAKIEAAFGDYMARHPEARKRALSRYEEAFGAYLPRHYDGSYLELPGLAVTLYGYQKDAVSRILNSKNVLLAHDVGSGKTFVMIAAGHELIRLGRSRKNLYVVPNNILGQWKQIYARCYPEAEVLAVEPGDFLARKREKTMEEIRRSKAEAVIMAYSSFDLMPLRGKDGKIGFADLGIDRLFLDEAHNYKNASMGGKRPPRKVSGMLEKSAYIENRNGGGGVVFATGTPVSNSIGDLFAMQVYLQGARLLELGLGSPAKWLAAFADYREEIEIDPTGNRYRENKRILGFVNLPELSGLLSEISSFHAVEKGEGLPEKGGYIDIKIEKDEALDTYVKYLAYRAERVKRKLVDHKRDNMLRITGDGRKAALSLRLVKKGDYPSKKAALCADIAADIYKKTGGEKLTQLVFCDISVHRPSGFSVYDELRDDLIDRGVPAKEIAFASDIAKNPDLYRKMQEGEIRILIGSTFKLGIGVNVQNKLIALHHLDVPWRPSDLAQREGRIIRRGNANKRVYIYRYISEGSFDAYSWQLLENKQRLIASLLSGSLEQRKAKDAADAVLDYAEVKAIAAGNPLVKKKAEAEAALLRAGNAKDAYERQRTEVSAELPELLGKIEDTERKIKEVTEDMPGILPKPNGEERSQILAEITKNLELRKDHLAYYRGFEIAVSPLSEKEFDLIGTGTYPLDIPKSAKGYLLRADGLLDNMDKYLSSLKENMQSLRSQKEESLKFLASQNPYVEEVEKAKLGLVSTSFTN